MLGGGGGAGGSPRGTERNSGTNSDNNPERALSICYSGRQSLDAGDIDQRNKTYEYEDEDGTFNHDDDETRL